MKFRRFTVIYSINRLFLSSRRTFYPFTYLFNLKWFRDNSSTRSQGVSITRQPFVTSATITWNSGDLQWYTLLIDCSSHRGAHFKIWNFCSISNGSRDKSSTRSEGVSITRLPFVTSATITWNPGYLQWYTLLIDCSSHRGAHFSHSHICSISNGSRDNSK